MKTNNFEYFPPRKQQGLADTCQSNALAAIFETFRRRAGVANDDLSRMFLHAEGGRLQGIPTGYTPSIESIIAVAKAKGVPPEYLHTYQDGHNYSMPAAETYAAAALAKCGAVGSIPLDPYNYSANAQAVRAALEQGYLCGMGFKRRQWFKYLWAEESEHLAIANAVQPGSPEHLHVDNHYIVIGDFDDGFMGSQGLAFALFDSNGTGSTTRDVKMVGPVFFRDTINIEVFKGFSGCNDRFTYDADGIPGQVYRLYQAAFNRTPDKGGLGYQIDAVRAGLPMWQLAMNFMASPEGQQKLPPTLTNAQYVDRLYDNVLHRPGDAQGIAHHLANLNGGMARHDVLMHFADSPENHTNTASVWAGGVAYT